MKVVNSHVTAKAKEMSHRSSRKVWSLIWIFSWNSKVFFFLDMALKFIVVQLFCEFLWLFWEVRLLSWCWFFSYSEFVFSSFSIPIKNQTRPFSTYWGFFQIPFFFFSDSDIWLFPQTFFLKGNKNASLSELSLQSDHHKCCKNPLLCCIKKTHLQAGSCWFGT